MPLQVNQHPFIETTLEGIKRAVERQVIRHPKTREITYTPDIVSLTRSQFDALVKMAERGLDA